MGIDGGGLFKEFMTELLKEVFDSDRGLWLTNKKNELYPNHGSYATERKPFPDAVSFTAGLVLIHAKRTASTGTDLLAEFWARRYTRESWWTLHSRTSSLPRFALSLLGSVPLLTSMVLPTAVARKAEFPRRPCLPRPGFVPGSDILEALPRESRRPFAELYNCRRRWGCK